MYVAKRYQRVLTSDDGPTAVEYAVMLALIIALSLLAINIIGTYTNTSFKSSANSIANGAEAGGGTAKRDVLIQPDEVDGLP